ncbi:MAG TPA: metal-sensitive transcriptional regulator [Candidatus Hydrogenedentes bacterium]|nr:metal-sensitive transcriptional regulator [Candidatus Hydrogenedentota bacterium]HOV73471.1 metal-sensitive transcriptional regulator [Candidatus Hydrogenedentota bacterium]HPC15513.1 metal-sensitive transcriptional regulator [Candidatus Hydrogenedentota bacterium]HRT20210.1 metal-sensitive transcriptional regulator [Candidatus Hydrogenedentota bacterium]HRT64272.1 metal-sensitive transcriptional regulator [Candidatus Hydrogenedentota bacterium]
MDTRKNVLDRLSRIEGQIKGVKRMVEEQRPCFDTLQQVGAIRGALRSLEQIMMEHHLCLCIEEAMRKKSDRERLLRELSKTLSGLLQ